MTYEFFKAVHLLGVILFLGNIIVTAIWKMFADRTQEPKVVAFSQRLVSMTDFVFTASGIVLIQIGAHGMASAGGFDLYGESWLVWGQGMFIASGVIWVLILIPVQTKLHRLARTFADGSPIPERYFRLNRHWYIWGVIATVLPLVNLYWMVYKP